MTQQAVPARIGARQMLNKVPEVTIWFWVIKILCTTVGESFADWINMTLGVGLVDTAILFTVIFAAVLTVQMTLRQYVPIAYWLTVVVVSVTGTLYTDILTDQLAVPLWISTTVFSVLLAAVFGIWYARERTLSIHTIVTVPRESFYWLAVLVTFALGTAAGDWTLELTGWGPGKSVLLPLALIGIVTVVWRLGANEVLTFWLAYILTRPLGANIGDWLATPSSEKGLGLGTFVTSIIFLGAILATVIYLSISRADVIESEEARPTGRYARPGRERPLLGVLVAVAFSTIGLLAWANQQPHASALEAEGPAPSCSGATLNQQQATQHVASKFPASSVDNYRTIAKDTLQLVNSGDQSGAASRVTDLETAWDDDQDSLQPKDCQAWTYVDKQIDPVLSAVRAANPDKAEEQQALNALLTTLG
ncbi:COG4705 family protein [Nocardioides sp. HB32]